MTNISQISDQISNTVKVCLSVLSPGNEAERARLLDVQVVSVEEVFVNGATDIDARIVGPRSEDQQAEQTDGESTPQIATVWDIRVQ